MLVHSLIDQSSYTNPDALYIKWPEASTYSEFSLRTKRVASWLASEGVKQGDRVIVLAGNRVEVLVALYAISRLGAVFCIVNGAVKPFGLKQITDQCEPTLILVDKPTEDQQEFLGQFTVRALDQLREIASSDTPIDPGIESIQVDAESPASLIFTSGSTGTPRGVVLSHNNICFASQAINQRLKYSSADVVGVFLPLSFDYGLYQAFISAGAGASLCIGSGELVGPRLLRSLEEMEVTVLPVVPALAAALIKLLERQTTAKLFLQKITNTGEQLPVAYIEKLKSLLPGIQVFPMYGLTECKRVSILLPEEYPSRIDSVGRALDGTVAKIISEEGEVLPPLEEGELVIVGPNVSLGYWKSPEETAKRFRFLADGTRELHTGDQCRMDADGFLYFVARKDSLLKHRGFRLSPHEIESAACDISGVLQAAAVKSKANEKLMLYVVTKDGLRDEKTIWDGLQSRLETYKLPDELQVIDQMPQTSNGKIDRKSLAAAE